MEMIRSILLVGGGSAGWISANLLHAILNDGTRPAIEITLVEAADIPTIGVGEATVPSIRRTLQTIGLPEAQFMSASDATFKNLIRFVDWNRGETFDHPFDRRLRPDTDEAARAWPGSGRAAQSFAKSFSVLSNTSDRNLAPKALGWPDYASTFPYAYHLDAIKLAALLAKVGVARGIRHRIANVTDAQIDAQGDIQCIHTDQGETLQADLYIDCTGFRGALIGEMLGVGKASWGDKLLCDRAVTMQVPYSVFQPDRLRPYTLATARSAGWSWDINLQNRRGIGYVYSSRFISDADAEQEFRAAEGAHAQDIPARIIEFASVKRDASWAGNCVAIGLADGFLEPLESSGLYMIEFAAEALADLVPYAGQDLAVARQSFNQRMRALYEEVAEYINLHYVTSARRDTAFWQAATHEDAIVETLRNNLELWRMKAPTDLDFLTTRRLFSLESYEYLLHGMGFTNDGKTDAGKPLPEIRGMLEKCYAKLPRHETWLASLERGQNTSAQTVSFKT